MPMLFDRVFLELRTLKTPATAALTWVEPIWAGADLMPPRNMVGE